MKKNIEKLLQRGLVFTTTTSFMLSCLLLLNSIIVKNFNLLHNFITSYAYTIIFISGLIFIGCQQIFVNEKTKSSGHIVFVVIYLLLESLLSFLLKSLTSLLVLIPFTIIHYSLTASFNELFVFHDYYEKLNEGKYGQKLKDFLYKNNFAASEFGQKNKKGQDYLARLGFTMLFLQVLSFVFGVKLSLNQSFIVILFYFFLFVDFCLTSLFSRQLYYNFLGFNDSKIKSRRTFFTSIAVFITAFFTGFIISSNKALVDINFISQRTQKVPHLESSHSGTYTEGFQGFQLQIDKFDDIVPTTDKGIVFIVLMSVIKYLFIAAVIAGILWFLIRPFFSQKWKEFWKEKKLITYLKRFLKAVKNLIFFILHIKKDDFGDYATVESKNFKNSIDDFLRSSEISKEKTLEMDKLTRKFAFLIDWGSYRKIFYTKNLAPAEFTQNLKSYFDVNLDTKEIEALDKAGFLFEKALYAKDILTAEEINEFFSCVDIIKNYGVN